MATAFERTLHALEARRVRRLGLSLALGMGILSLWTLWSLRADLGLYEVSEQARLEVDRASYPVQSPMLGRVVALHLALGQEVAAGDVLVELDAEAEQLQLRQEEVRLAAIPQDRRAIEAQIAAEEQARAEEQRTTRLAMAEAQARRDETEAPATFAATDAERLTLLRTKGLIAERDYQRGIAEAQKTRATATGPSSRCTGSSRSRRRAIANVSCGWSGCVPTRYDSTASTAPSQRLSRSCAMRSNAAASAPQ